MNEQFEIGDFVRNKIHGYISLFYKRDAFQPHCINALTIDVSVCEAQWITDFIKEGYIRLELPSELEKVPFTLSLIVKAKKYLDKLNSDKNQQLDNLGYIEILNKLNEQEKALKNENKL